MLGLKYFENYEKFELPSENIIKNIISISGVFDLFSMYKKNAKMIIPAFGKNKNVFINI
jgi:hypothetical protein